jgi:hypothetical protein
VSHFTSSLCHIYFCFDEKSLKHANISACLYTFRFENKNSNLNRIVGTYKYIENMAVMTFKSITYICTMRVVISSSVAGCLWSWLWSMRLPSILRPHFRRSGISFASGVTHSDKLTSPTNRQFQSLPTLRLCINDLLLYKISAVNFNRISAIGICRLCQQ